MEMELGNVDYIDYLVEWENDPINQLRMKMRRRKNKERREKLELCKKIKIFLQTFMPIFIKRCVNQKSILECYDIKYTSPIPLNYNFERATDKYSIDSINIDELRKCMIRINYLLHGHDGSLYIIYDIYKLYEMYKKPLKAPIIYC